MIKITTITSVFFLFLNVTVLGLNLTTKKLSSMDGLSNSAITVLHQDSMGIMWIGTWDGLNSYDGQNISIYKSNKKDKNSLSSNVIFEIIEPQKGILWISTPNGLNRLNTYTKEIQRFFEDKAGKSNTRSSHSYNLTTGPDLSIFCAVKEQAVYYFNNEKKQFIPLSIKQFNKKRIAQLSSDCNGALLILTTTGEIFQLKMKMKDEIPIVESCTQILKQHFIQSIIRKSGNDFWVIDKEHSHIYTFNNKHNTFKQIATLNGLPIQSKIQTINEINNELIVGFTTVGLFRYDSIHGKWIQDLDPNYNGGVLSSYSDKKQQILWIGTNNNGVISKYKEKLNFKSILNKELSEGNGAAIRSLFEDYKGQIWVGSRGNGINIIANLKAPRLAVQNIPAFSNKSIMSMAQGPDNLIFIGTESDGLFICDPNTLKARPIDLSIIKAFNVSTSRPIYSLYWDNQQSTLWIGTNNNGAFQIKLGLENSCPKITEYFCYNQENKSGLTNNSVFSISQDSNLKTWVSTRGGGVFLINGKTHKVELNINEYSASPLSDNDVLCLKKSSNGTIWAGTSGGLNHFSNVNGKIVVQQFTEQNGLANNTVHGILEAKNKDIWISTNYGLSKINIKTKQITNYFNGYGLQSNEYSDGAFTQTRQGELLFGGINGLNHFDAFDFEERKFSPNTLLTAIKINNTPINLSELKKNDSRGEYIALKYNQNFFDIDYIAIDYINNTNCEYSYILEGFNKKWVQQGTKHTATFTNVNPGEYILKIKATNGDKVWNEKPTIVRIKISEPWWNSWLAYSFYFLLLCLIAYYLYTIVKKRIELNRSLFEEKLKKKEQELTYEAKLRFFTNVAHEFCTPLTLIYGPCDRLLENENTDASSLKYIKIIKSNAERMQRLIDDLMDFRKAETENKKLAFENIDINELAKYICDSFNEFSEQKKITLFFDFKNENQFFISDRDAVEKILFNLISNAYKYTNEGGKISLKIDTTPENLLIKIRNTGLGIKKQDLQNVFNRFHILDNFERNVELGRIQRTGIGLALTKSLVSLLKGEISVDSEENEFTEFRIQLPAVHDVELKPQRVTELVKTSNQAPIVSNGEKPLILIIDDEKEILNLLKDILSPNYSIIEAGDGKEGVEKLKHHQPTVIISDVMMPNMTGIELLKEIKNNQLISHIPVVFLSSKATMEDQISNYERGLEFFIAKPFNSKLLLSVVNRIVNSRGSLKEYYNSSISSIEEFSGNFIHADEKKFLVSIADIIKKNMEDEGLDSDFICEQLNITRILLYRKIKELANTTPTEFIREIKLKEAERLIRTTRDTIQEIMYQTGFNNKSNFYRIFKAAYTLSPSEYRKKSQVVE